jgi:hypothetical protein
MVAVLKNMLAHSVFVSVEYQATSSNNSSSIQTKTVVRGCFR